MGLGWKGVVRGWWMGGRGKRIEESRRKPKPSVHRTATPMLSQRNHATFRKLRDEEWHNIAEL